MQTLAQHFERYGVNFRYSYIVQTVNAGAAYWKVKLINIICQHN